MPNDKQVVVDFKGRVLETLLDLFVYLYCGITYLCARFPIFTIKYIPFVFDNQME